MLTSWGNTFSLPSSVPIAGGGGVFSESQGALPLWLLSLRLRRESHTTTSGPTEKGFVTAPRCDGGTGPWSLEPSLSSTGVMVEQARVFREEAGSDCWAVSSSAGRLVVGGGVVVAVLSGKGGGESTVGGGDETIEHPMLQGKEDSLLSLLPLLASRVLTEGLLPFGVPDEVGGVADEEWSISARGVNDIHLWDVTRGHGSRRGRVLRKENNRAPVIYLKGCHLLKFQAQRCLLPSLTHGCHSLTPRESLLRISIHRSSQAFALLFSRTSLPHV